MLKITLSLCLFMLMFAAYSEASLTSKKPPLPKPGRTKPGPVKEISPDRREIRNSLKRVIAKKNPNIKIVKINEATKKTIIGYAYNVQFLGEEDGKQKTCYASYVDTLGSGLLMDEILSYITKFECK